MTAVRRTLRDPLPGITWLDSDLLRFLNNARRNVVVLRPELLTLRAAIPMVAGVLQAIPAAGTVLFKLDHNVTGRRLRLVDAAMLDTALAAWPGVTATAEVQEYATDTKDRKRFLVYPPNTGAGSVIALYGITPTPLVLSTEALGLDDEFEPALRELMLAEAFGFITPKQDLNRIAMHRKNAESLLGINEKSEADKKPKYGATPGSA